MIYKLVKNYFFYSNQQRIRQPTHEGATTENVSTEPFVLEMKPLTLDQAKMFAKNKNVEDVRIAF